ncbi:uncharacterized protein FOMMEDRAFT_187171 [Fomitiporia mediterranea MF3/22]|uniref:uncharacterized protein n=1 Tax=Fomitiporia mediterranea (strain MF3/22) TaxID=694068 RepID=UPI0004408071|nr:uncharacterized protein FOMMEDRAFT_187171 [Fomitiporia mediterranea MF3/22]EJD08183.1 hypothetical protein FOMMEDRAFT_187171 [Fomitiporia mediterranea MF3/22]
MKLQTTTSLSILLSFAALAKGQQSVWGQCGGIGWTGATTCVSGSTCTKQNDYYSQCIPGAASSAPTPTSTSAAGAPTATLPSGVNFWFSFGDSYTQTGFDPTGVLPTVGNPMGNPPYPGYTAVGGVNWIDLLTVQFNNSLILTYNYAYGGATIDASLVQPYEPTVLSMTDQVNEFLTGTAKKPATTLWTGADALFSFWIGINDIGNSYYQSGDRDAFSDTLLDAYFALVEKITTASLEAGIFYLSTSLPLTGLLWRVMLAQAASAQALEKSVIAGYNTKLAQRATQLVANHSDAKTWVWDSNTVFTVFLDNPTAFGFVDATSYGATGDFWGNNLHPSAAAHTILAQNCSTVLDGTVW